ncbi:hypothetical protein PHK61_22985 [Actinomycetospora lutea]|uniref:hypothetical protein n=1 Tax=Actinomycetospora lutea TaxID=663604 RepID=UPI00236558D1|nr:hypothetical protein [Actinomycetospora lutea]MDD7941289.1 hypothetical protein [Actinomycetospora lutea]
MDEQDGSAVRPEELREAGAACVAAGLEVPVGAPAEAVRGTEVDPGGGAGAAAAALAERWEAAHAQWCADLVAHGEALAAAAVAYVAGDGAAATGLMGAGG